MPNAQEPPSAGGDCRSICGNRSQIPHYPRTFAWRGPTRLIPTPRRTLNGYGFTALGPTRLAIVRRHHRQQRTREPGSIRRPIPVGHTQTVIDLPPPQQQRQTAKGSQPAVHRPMSHSENSVMIVCGVSERHLPRMWEGDIVLVQPELESKVTRLTYTPLSDACVF